jgi:alpha-soluble NSF attachment protein
MVIYFSCRYLTYTFICRTANSCFKDAADLHADLEEYPQAITRYEQVANYSLASSLTKYSVKEYWLRAGLCALALGVSFLNLESMILSNSLSRRQDPVTAKRNTTKYSTQDATFSSTREAKFLLALIEAVEAGDSEAFTGAVVGFDQVTKLDNWKTNILLKIKRSIQDEMTLT